MRFKYKLYLFIIGILIILITILIVLVNKRNYTIKLSGDNPLILYEGNNYIEPGYSAKDNKEKDATYMVNVISDLDVSKEGTYEMIYTIDGKFEVRRYIEVREFIPEDLEVKFELKGETVIDLDRDKTYIEPGYTAIGTNGKDYSKYVKVVGNINILKVGTYQLEYNLNIGKTQKTLIRTINVVGDKYTTKINVEKPTNQNIIITVQNNLKEFSYFITPTNLKLTDEKVEYVVTDNGKYVFYMYDIRNNEEKIEVEVSNIDRIKPTGYCEGQAVNDLKKYKITSEDNDIERYVYNNQTFFENSFQVVSNFEDDKVILYDKAGNSNEILCEYSEIYSKSKQITRYSSKTLKYWIEKPNSNYVVTHIWVKDAYNQMKTAINKKLGVLETGKTILNNEIKSKSYNKKGLIAVNASGFLMTSKEPHIAYDKSWAFTSHAPVIIVDGKIVRNLATKNLPNDIYPIYGLKSNGYLSYFNLNGGENEIENNKKVIESALNDGIKYTFSFTPILVLNGKVNSTSTSNNIRQALCQIDRNNFVIVTNINPTTNRRAGFSFKDLAEYMVKLNCQTAFNLDGGGSVNLYYKKSSNDLIKVNASNRKIFDMLYFVE